MPEEAVIDTPETAKIPEPPRSPGFNALKDKFIADTDQALKQPPVQPAPIDTAPKPLPEAKKEPVKAKEPAKTEPAKETPPSDKEEYSKKKAADWKQLVSERDEWKTKAETFSKFEKEAADYKAKITEFETKGPKLEEVEALRKERQAALDKLERVALEQSEKFSSYYNSRFEQAMAQALDAVPKDKAEQIKAVLEAPKSAWRKNVLNEVVESMENQVDKLNLIAAVNEYDRVRSERTKTLDDHKAQTAKWREVEQQKQREAQEQDTARRKDMAATVLKTHASKFEAFQEKEGDDEHNASVLKAKKLVEDFVMGALDDGTAISLPLKAAEYDRLSKKLPALEAKLKEQEEALAALKQATPTSGNIPPGQSQEKPKSYKERVMELMPKT